MQRKIDFYKDAPGHYLLPPITKMGKNFTLMGQTVLFSTCWVVFPLARLRDVGPHVAVQGGIG
jgi:hypothetical protein